MPRDCKGIKNLILIPFEVQAAFEVVVYAQLYLYLGLQGLHSWLEEKMEMTTRDKKRSHGEL